MSDQKEYVLYKNLEFMWRKKWFLIIIPLVICLVVSAFSFFSGREYVGKAVFYTSTLKKDELTDPFLMNANYVDEDQEVVSEFSVLQNKRVQIKVIGETKQEVEEELDLLSAKYSKDLKADYKLRYDTTKETMESYQENLLLAEKQLEQYYSAVEAKEDDALPDTELLSAAVTKEELIYEYETSVNRMKTDLLFFEEPKLISKNIVKSDNFLVQNAIISLVLSFFLTLLAVLLWRYILEARGGLRND